MSDELSFKSIGRKAVLNKIRTVIQDAKQTRPTGGHIAIIGDRGVGKSLLLSDIHDEYKKAGDAVAFIPLDRTVDNLAFTNRLSASLSMSISSLSDLKRIKEYAKKINSIGFFGISASAMKTPGDPIGDLAFEIIRHARYLSEKNKTRRVIIIIDEIDSANEEILSIGALIKTLAEYFQFHDVRNVVFVIAGLPGTQHKIIRSHPSAWRIFTPIYIGQLDSEPECRDLIDITIRRSLETGIYASTICECALSPSALRLLIKLSDKYPNWLITFTKTSLETALSRCQYDMWKIEISRSDVELARHEAFQFISSNYFEYDFSLLPETEKLILRLIAAHRSYTLHELDLFEAMDLLLTGSEPVLSTNRAKQRERYSKIQRAIEKLRTSELIDVSYDGAFSVMSIRSNGLHRWLVSSLISDLEPQESFDGTPTLTIFRIAGESVSGKYVTTFAEFLKLFSFKNLKLNAKNFSALSLVHDLASSHSEFRKCWDESDVVAIPNYLTGWANEQGIYDLEEILSRDVESAALCREWKSYLHFSLVNFEETCCYNGRWVAIPFCYLTKLLGSISPHDPLTRWPEKPSDQLSEFPRYSLECGEFNIGFWYEWRHIVGTPIANSYDKRRTGQEVPDPVDGLDSHSDVFVNELFKASMFFGRLLEMAHLRKVWADAMEAPSTTSAQWSPVFFSWWSDSIPQFQDVMESRGEEVSWHPLPYFGATTLQQPIETWGFVFPKSKDDIDSAKIENIALLARYLVRTLSTKWQMKYQERTGCSPFNRILNASSVQFNQPWADFMAEAVGSTLVSGRCMIEPELILGELDFLSSLYSGIVSRDAGSIAKLRSETDFEEHFNSCWRTFRRVRNQLIDTARSASIK